MDDYHLYEHEEPDLSGLDRAVFDAVSQEEPWNLVERFAGLDRISGGEDEREAADYVTDRLDAFGVDYDRYDPELPITHPEDASVTVPGGETFAMGDGDRPGVKPELFSRAGMVTAEAVHLDAGDPSAVFDPGEIDCDVAGKVVVVETRLVSIDLKEALEDRGAAAVVGVHPHEKEPFWGRVSTKVWGAIPGPDENDEHEIVAVAVSREVGDRLLEHLAGDDEPTLTVSAVVAEDWYPCPAVVARVEGGGDTDDFVLFHGHIDSWHGGVTDNATGDAGLLECARVFSDLADQLERDLWIAWWPGHTQGSYAGSAWFVDQFALELDERCVAHVNIDSPGAKDATEFGDFTMWMSEGEPLCTDAIADVAGKEASGVRPLRAGDYSFNNLGVTGLHLISSNIPTEVRERRGYVPAGSGGNSDAYHLTTDTLDKADLDVLVRDIRVYAVTLARLLAADIVPLDFRRTIEEHRTIVAGYDDAAEDAFDLSPVLDALDRLDRELDAFYDRVDEEEVDPKTANQTIKHLSRRLVPVNFATAGRFEQDPTTHRPPYPSLEPVTDLQAATGERRRSLRTHLIRARNAVVHELREARRATPGRSD